MFFNFFKKTSVFFIFIIINFTFFYLVVLASPDSPVNNPGTDIQICTKEIEDCCAGYGRPKFEWELISESGGSFQAAYWLQVDNNSDFSSPAVDTGAVSSYINYFIPPEGVLEASTVYYWRVGIKDNFDSWSSWAEGDSFEIPIVGCGCDSGTEVVPYNYPGTDIQVCTESIDENSCCSGSASMPSLQWLITSESGNSFQTAYWLQVDNNSDFSSPVVNTGQIISTVSSYVIEEGTLDGYIDYYWRVAVRDNFDSWTDWAEGESFQMPEGCSYIPGTPPSPFPVEAEWSMFEVCTDSVEQLSCYGGYFPTPTFNWIFTSLDGITSQVAYWLQVDNNSDFSSPEYDSGAVLSSADYHQICSDALEFGTNYYWRLAVKDNRGTWVDWTSPGELFTTNLLCAPDAPTMGDITDLAFLCYGVKVEWIDNSDSEIGFNVQVRIDGGDWQDFCNVSSNITSCSSALDPSTTYYFRVKALGEDDDSTWSPDESGKEHGTGYCAPSLEFGQYNCAVVNLSWSQEGSGVDYYEIWRKAGGANWIIIEDDIVNTQFNYADTDIVSGVEYQYKIVAQNAGIDSNIVSVYPCPNLPCWQEVKP
jgi:hypothetical protein